MRIFFAFFGLLLCLIDTRACELPVIKDSEAVHYVGRNVEVRGFVVSVTTSPLGTAFINFGRDYPNQTFAGFIAAGSKIATDTWIAALQGEIHRHHRHDRTSPWEAGDRSHVARSDQSLKSPVGKLVMMSSRLVDPAASASIFAEG
jgi:hypothetical protein